ncbi:MAG TPA: hypothetical protein VM580_22840, partial [Labilithrix sp.]|nr:hypothetical protein [Labilithrix sp.]
MPMYERKQIGPHTLWFEPDNDFIVVVQVGKLDAAHASELTSFVRERAALKGRAPMYMLADHRQATGITSEARKVFSTPSSDLPSFEFNVATFGASFAMRTVVNLLFKATKLAGISTLTI